MRAHKAHVRPEGPEGAWRASHTTLWFLRSPPASAPSYMSYTSYMSYRVVLCGTSQTCRGCRENEGAWPCHPCRGVGQRPTPSILQSANQLIPLCPLWAFVLFVVKNWQSFVSLWKWVSPGGDALRGRAPWCVVQGAILDGRIRQFSGVAVCTAGGSARTVRFVAVPSGKLVTL